MDTQTIEIRVPKRKVAPRVNKAEEQRILRLRTENKLPITEIAPILDRHPSTIDRVLKRADPKNQVLQEFKGKESDVISLIKSTRRVNQLVAQEVLAEQGKVAFERMTPKEIAQYDSYSSVADANDTKTERLIRGLSTSNMAYGDVTQAETEADARIRELEAKLARPQPVVFEQV